MTRVVQMIAGAVAALALAVLPAAPAAAAAPALKVSKSADLVEGEKITVDGSGFRAGLKSVAVGICKSGYKGPSDCDLGGGATFVNIDAKGAFPTVTLTARAKFGSVDCMTQQCVIGVAPLPGTVPDAIVAANTADVHVGWHGSTFKGGTVPTPAAAPAAPASGGDGPSTLLWAITLGVLVAAGGAAALVQRRT